MNVWGEDIASLGELMSLDVLTTRTMALLNSTPGRFDPIREITRMIKEHTGFGAVGVRLKEGDDYPYYETRGFSKRFIEDERYLGRNKTECLCGCVLRGEVDSGEPCFTKGGSFWTNSTTDLLGSDLARRICLRNRCNQEGFESVALVPLRSKAGVVGLLQLNDRRRDRFSSGLVEFFETFASSISIAHALGRLGAKPGPATAEVGPGRGRDLDGPARALWVQRDLAQELAETTDLGDGLETCVARALEATAFDAGGAYLVDSDSGSMKLVYAEGLSNGFVSAARTFDGASENARIVRQGQPIFRTHQEIGVDVSDARRNEGLRAMAILPVMHEGRAIACLNLASHKSNEISDDDRAVAESIAAQMGSIIARLKESEAHRREMEFLAESAMGLVSFAADDDVFQYIAERYARVAGGTVVAVSSFDESCRQLVVDAVSNLGEIAAGVRKVIGRDVVGMKVPISEETVASLARGRLVALEGDLHEITGEVVLPETGDRIAGLLALDGVEAVGFARDGRLFGAVVFLMRRGSKSLERTLVEAFAGQAAVALERRRTEIEKATIEEQFRHAQKMAAIGTLAGGVVHDFNNLLTSVLGHANMLKRQFSPGEQVFESAETIETAAIRAAELTKQLVSFARQGVRREVPMDLLQIVDEVRFFLEHTVDKRISIRVSTAGEQLVSMGDPSQIQAVILNLAVNARDAMEDGGELLIATRHTSDEELSPPPHHEVPKGPYGLIEVVDTGTGIEQEVLDRIFDPFFTTKTSDRGSGLGLAMVYGIVADHGGWVEVDSEVGRGSVFSVFLPLAKEELSLIEAQPATPLRGKGHILVVDDEVQVRRVIGRMLTSLGYGHTSVSDGRAAVDYYREHGDEIDAIVLDLDMPKLDGLGAFEELKAIDPGVRAVLVTGRVDGDAVRQMREDGLIDYLEKPFVLESFSRVLHRAVMYEKESE